MDVVCDGCVDYFDGYIGVWVYFDVDFGLVDGDFGVGGVCGVVVC